MKADFLAHLAPLPQRPGGGYRHGNMSDVLPGPAGAPHRFENFSQDFVTWVVFCGPPQGEKP